MVSFADCLEPEFYLGEFVDNEYLRVQWYFLAITNINIRQGSWTMNESKPRGPRMEWLGRRPSSWTVSNEISAMSSYAINDITTTSFSKAPVEGRVSGRITEVLGQELWPDPTGFRQKTQEDRKSVV